MEEVMEENEKIKNIIRNLKEYLDEDFIYQTYLNNKNQDFTDFEEFCINHCQDIEFLIKYYEELISIKSLPKLKSFTRDELETQYKNKQINLDFMFDYIVYRDSVYNLLIQRNALLERRIEKIRKKISEANTIDEELWHIACGGDNSDD